MAANGSGVCEVGFKSKKLLQMIKLILKIYLKKLIREQRQIFLDCHSVQIWTIDKKHEAFKLISEDVSKKIAAVELLLKDTGASTP